LILGWWGLDFVNGGGGSKSLNASTVEGILACVCHVLQKLGIKSGNLAFWAYNNHRSAVVGGAGERQVRPMDLLEVFNHI